MEKLIEQYNKLSPEEKLDFHEMVTISYHSTRLEGSELTEEQVFIICLKSRFKENQKGDESI
jgi:hypothetical protein